MPFVGQQNRPIEPHLSNHTLDTDVHDNSFLNNNRHAIVVNADNQVVRDDNGRPKFMDKEQILPVLKQMFGTLDRVGVLARCCLLREQPE